MVREERRYRNSQFEFRLSAGADPPQRSAPARPGFRKPETVEIPMMCRSDQPKIPPLGGVCTHEEAQRTGYSVARDVELLRRYYFLKKQLMFLEAAHISPVPEWEVKGALSLHAWLDAEHVTWLGERIAEMREPPLRLDEDPDPALRSMIDEAFRAQDTIELLVGIYRVLRPALLTSYERHRAETNPLVDHATCRILRFMALEEEEMVTWGEQAIRALLAADPGAEAGAEDWRRHLEAYLAAAGGVHGDEKPPAGPELPKRRATEPFEPDVMPRRDGRFSGLFNTTTPADTVYLDRTRSAAERNLALLYKRLREMDVPEVIAAILVQTRGRPWEYYRDLARQLWDEARHSMMGEVAFAQRNIDWTRLPVNMTFSYKLNKFLEPEERHILLYDIEQSLMRRDLGKRYEWQIARQAGDPLSTTFHDFDWADEVLHVAIGKRCLLGHLRGGREEALRRAPKIWEKLEESLRREPFPERDDRRWWEDFARQVLGETVPPVVSPEQWRPPKSA